MILSNDIHAKEREADQQHGPMGRGTLLGKTNVVKKDLNPVWAKSKNSFSGDVPEKGGCLVVEVWDHDMIGFYDVIVDRCSMCICSN